MADRPAPPFQTDLSEQARDDIDRQPDLAPTVNAILLRGANEVRRHLEMGDNLALDLFGRREQVTVRISLIPPETVRIEQVSPGGPVPEGAMVV